MAEQQELHADIYWPDGPSDEFYALPEKEQIVLASFMEKQRLALEQMEGGERESLIAVWDDKYEWAVSWDVKLKPEYRTSKHLTKPSVQQTAGKKVPLGAYYRIEVLRVWKL
jgi:hypothetical protein